MVPDFTQALERLSDKRKREGTPVSWAYRVASAGASAAVAPMRMMKNTAPTGPSGVQSIVPRIPYWKSWTTSSDLPGPCLTTAEK